MGIYKVVVNHAGEIVYISLEAAHMYPALLRTGIRDWKRLGYASIRLRSALLDGLLPGFDPL